MRPPRIGDRVRREKLQAIHIVESLVANDAITKCGKRLRDDPTGDGELIVNPLAGLACTDCGSGSSPA